MLLICNSDEFFYYWKCNWFSIKLFVSFSSVNDKFVYKCNSTPSHEVNLITKDGNTNSCWDSGTWFWSYGGINSETGGGKVFLLQILVSYSKLLDDIMTGGHLTTKGTAERLLLTLILAMLFLSSAILLLVACIIQNEPYTQGSNL